MLRSHPPEPDTPAARNEAPDLNGGDVNELSWFRNRLAKLLLAKRGYGTARSRVSALATRFEVAGLLGLTEGAHIVQT